MTSILLAIKLQYNTAKFFLGCYNLNRPTMPFFVGLFKLEKWSLFTLKEIRCLINVCYGNPEVVINRRRWDP